MRANKVIATIMAGGLTLLVVTAEIVEIWEGKPSNGHTHAHYDYQRTSDSGYVVNAGSGDFRMERPSF